MSFRTGTSAAFAAAVAACALSGCGGDGAPGVGDRVSAFFECWQLDVAVDDMLAVNQPAVDAVYLPHREIPVETGDVWMLDAGPMWVPVPVREYEVFMSDMGSEGGLSLALRSDDLTVSILPTFRDAVINDVFGQMGTQPLAPTEDTIQVFGVAPTSFELASKAFSVTSKDFDCSATSLDQSRMLAVLFAVKTVPGPAPLQRRVYKDIGMEGSLVTTGRSPDGEDVLTFQFKDAENITEVSYWSTEAGAAAMVQGLPYLIGRATPEGQFAVAPALVNNAARALGGDRADVEQLISWHRTELNRRTVDQLENYLRRL